jgi:hypothetical protein
LFSILFQNQWFDFAKKISLSLTTSIDFKNSPKYTKMEEALLESNSLFLELQKELEELKQANVLSHTRRSLYTTLESSSSTIHVSNGLIPSIGSTQQLSSNPSITSSSSSSSLFINEPLDPFEAETRALEMRLRALRDTSSQVSTSVSDHTSLLSSEKQSTNENSNGLQRWSHRPYVNINELEKAPPSLADYTRHSRALPSPLSTTPFTPPIPPSSLSLPLSTSKPFKQQQQQQHSHLTFEQAFSEAKAKLVSASELVRQDAFRKNDPNVVGGENMSASIQPLSGVKKEKDVETLMITSPRDASTSILQVQSQPRSGTSKSIEPSNSTTTLSSPPVTTSGLKHKSLVGGPLLIPTPTLQSVVLSPSSSSTTTTTTTEANIKPKRDKIFSILSPSSSSSSSSSAHHSTMSSVSNYNNSLTTEATSSSSSSSNDQISPVIEKTRALFAVAAAKSSEIHTNISSQSAHTTTQQPAIRFIRPSPSILSSSLAVSAPINFGKMISETRRLQHHLYTPTISQKWASEQAAEIQAEQMRKEEEERLYEEAQQREIEERERLEREAIEAKQRKEEEAEYQKAEDERIAFIYERSSEETKKIIADASVRLHNILEAIEISNTPPPRGKALFRITARTVMRTARESRKEKHKQEEHERTKNAISTADSAAAFAAEQAAYFNSPAFKKLPPHIRTQQLKESRSRPASVQFQSKFHQAKIGNLLNLMAASKQGTF